MQRWRKLGLLVDGDGDPIRMAGLPTVMPLTDGRARLYYGAIDADTVSRVVFVEIDLARPTEALSAPVQALDIGAPGYFDDNGVVPCSFLHQGDRTYLLYAGFQKQTKVPYTILTGLAHSHDGGITFERARTTPLFERSSAEPFIRSAPCVIATPAGLRVWYVGGGGRWIHHGDRVLPTYSLRSMASTDIEQWPAAGETCLTPVGDEIGFGRPWVMRNGDGYRIWYSIRKLSGYNIGYAESPDGIRLQRLDEVDLGPTIPGFDDEMRCYSCVFAFESRLLMFYNGNGYGRAGVGVAVLDSDESL